MERKKKYHGKSSLLFGLLFCLLLGFSSTTCYASISDDYLNYALNTLKSYSGDQYVRYRNIIDLAITNVDTIKQNLNALEVTYNLTNLQDVNYSFFVKGAGGSYPGFFIVISNNTAGGDNLNFIQLNNNGFTPYSNDGSLLYILEIESSGSFTSLSYNNSTLNYGYVKGWNRGSYSINENDTVLTLTNCAFAKIPAGYWTYNFEYGNSVYPVIFKDIYGNFGNSSPEPELPSGDQGDGGTTTPSGDSSGDNSDMPNYTPILNDINSNISNQGTAIINNQNENTDKIVNTLSGETNKITNTLTESANMNNTNITSGDILDNFSFMEDPYSNFWWNFIDGIKLALLGSVRQLPINWLGYNGYFNLDGLINYPTSLKNILTTVSTVAVVWVMLKWWKVIMDKLTSGDVDEVLEILEEQGRVNITNLF